MSSLVFNMLYSQTYYGGGNIYFSYNRFTIGGNFMKLNKHHTIYHEIMFNAGLTGYKKYPPVKYGFTSGTYLGRGVTVIGDDSPYALTGAFKIPYGNYLNAYTAKVFGSFIKYNFAFVLKDNKQHALFHGFSVAYFWNIDKGTYNYYSIYTPDKKGELITKKLNVRFNTYSIGNFFSYSYRINKHWKFQSTLYSSFYFPVLNKEYGIAEKFPLKGVGFDLSCSILYKF